MPENTPKTSRFSAFQRLGFHRCTMTSSTTASFSQKTNHDNTPEWLRCLHPYFPEMHTAQFAPKVDKHQVARAFGNRAVSKLVDLISFDDLDDDARCSALQLLRELTASQTEKQMAIDGGAVEACTALLLPQEDESFSIRDDIQEAAALLLSSLAVAPQAISYFDKNRTIAALSESLKSDSEKIREAAALAFMNFSTSRDGSLIIIHYGKSSTEAISIMVRSLVEPSPLVSLYLVTTLGYCCRYEEGIELALVPGVVKKLVQMLEMTSESDAEIPIGSPLVGLPEGSRLQTLNTIWNLSNHLKAKMELIEHDAIPAITKTLSDPSHYVRRCAAGALMALSIDESGKREILEYALESLPRLLLDENEATRTNTTICLRQTSENPRALEAFCRQLLQPWTGAVKMSSDLILRVFGITAAKPLCGVLDSSKSPPATPDEVERAVVAIADIVDVLGDKGNDAMMSTLYVTERLAALLDDPRETVSANASAALMSLCNKHSYGLKRLRKYGSSKANAIADQIK